MGDLERTVDNREKYLPEQDKAAGVQDEGKETNGCMNSKQLKYTKASEFV